MFRWWSSPRSRQLFQSRTSLTSGRPSRFSVWCQFSSNTQLVFSFISDFLSTVSVLLPSRVKLCIAPPPGRISLKLRLRSFDPHRQDWICLRRRGGGGCQGVADQPSSWELELLLRMLFMSIGLLCVIAVLASLALWINNVWDVQIGELGIQENHNSPPWAFVFLWPPSVLYIDKNIEEKYALLWYSCYPPICPLNPVLLRQFQLGHRLPSNDTEANDHQHLVHLDLQAANHLSTLALALEQTASAMVPTNLLTCFIPYENLWFFRWHYNHHGHHWHHWHRSGTNLTHPGGDAVILAKLVADAEKNCYIAYGEILWFVLGHFSGHLIFCHPSLELSSGITTARGCGVGGDLVQYLQVWTKDTKKQSFILFQICEFHLEFSCSRALLMCSGKTLSASQGLDSMTHRRSDIKFSIKFRYFRSHVLLSIPSAGVHLYKGWLQQGLHILTCHLCLLSKAWRRTKCHLCRWSVQIIFASCTSKKAN